MTTQIIGTENLPNVYIRDIGIEAVANSVKITPTIHLYDTPSGGWYSEEMIKANLKILVVLSSSETFSKSIYTGRSPMTPDQLFKIEGYNTMEVQHKVLSIGAVNREAFKNELENGHIVFPYKCYFSTDRMENVSVFAVCYLDVKQFSAQNNLDLSTSNVNAYHGAITGEEIFVNGELPKTTYSFFYENDVPYVGPVHRHPSGYFMEGSKHSPTQHSRVYLKTMPNTKIKDYRVPFLTKMKNTTKYASPSPIFSQLYPSVDSNGTLSATFDINIEQLYLQTSKYAKILHSVDETLYKKAIRNLAFSEITIYTQKAKSSLMSTELGTKKVSAVAFGVRKRLVGSKDASDGLQLAFEYSDNTVFRDYKTDAALDTSRVARATDTPRNPNSPDPVFQDESKASAMMMELNMFKGQTDPLQQRDRRTFCFKQKNDRFLNDENFYSVEVFFKDPSEAAIKGVIREAKVGLSSLKGYKSKVERATNYNYYADQTKKELIDSSNDQFTLSIVTKFMSMYNVLYDTTDLDVESFLANLVRMIHPKTLSTKSLGWFYESYSAVFNKFTKYFNELDTETTPEVKLGYVQRDPNKGKLFVKNTFEGTVNFSNYKSSVSFMPMEIFGVGSKKGMYPVINYANYRAMVRAERVRFLNSDPNFTAKSVPSVDADMISYLNNVEYHSYTYFSPSTITHGQNNTIDLSRLETLSLSQFNQSYNMSSFNQGRYLGYSPMSRRQGDIRTGRRSPIYVRPHAREREEVQSYSPAETQLGRESSFSAAGKEEVVIDTPSLDRATLNRFSSYARGKTSDYNISFEDYNLKNQNNVLAEVTKKQTSIYNKRKIARAIPLQIKAIMGSEYGFAKNNIFYAQGDLLKDSMVRELVKTCFMSLVKVQFLDFYSGDNVALPYWRDMTSTYFDGRVVDKKKTVLCRFVPYEDSTMKIESDLFTRLGIENKYFLLSPDSSTETLNTELGAVGYEELNFDNNLKDIPAITRAYINESMLQDDIDLKVSSKSILISQPIAKNGPLLNVDYLVENDLVTNRTIESRSEPLDLSPEPPETDSNLDGPNVYMETSAGSGTGRSSY